MAILWLNEAKSYTEILALTYLEAHQLWAQVSSMAIQNCETFKILVLNWSTMSNDWSCVPPSQGGTIINNIYFLPYYHKRNKFESFIEGSVLILVLKQKKKALNQHTFFELCGRSKPCRPCRPRLSI